jgi:hypothetical protein
MGKQIGVILLRLMPNHIPPPPPFPEHRLEKGV